MTTPQQQRREALRAMDEQALAARRGIVAAFHDAARQGLPRPSVTAICRAAGVARSTFYTHFAAVDDLAMASIGEVFADASAIDVRERHAEHPDRAEITRAGLERVLAALEQSRALLDYAVRIGSRALVLEQLVAQFSAFTRETIDAEYAHLDEGARALANEFVSAATAHALLRWLGDPAGVPREALLDQLVGLLPARLTAER